MLFYHCGSRPPRHTWLVARRVILVLTAVIALPVAADNARPVRLKASEALPVFAMGGPFASSAAAPASASSVQRTDASCRWQVGPQMRTLREALEQWSAQSEWQSVWELDIDIPLDLSARFCGSLESAVEEVLSGFASHSTPIRATFYRGNRVLRLWAANQ